jgi:hypothetical protein
MEGDGNRVGRIVSQLPPCQPLVKELAFPDLLTREKKPQIIEAAFFFFQRTIAPGNKEGISPMLALSCQSGKIADTLTVRGLNLKPEESGLL